MKNVVIVLILLLIVGCNKLSLKKNEAKLINHFSPKQIYPYNPSLTVGLHKNQIYYFSQGTSNTYEVNLLSLNFDVVKSIKINKGKGPGEIINPSHGLSFFDQKFAVYDSVLNKLVIYKIDGSLLEEYNLDNIIPRGGSFAIDDNYLYYHGVMTKKLLKIDYKKSKIIDTLEYQEKYQPNRNYLSKKRVRIASLKIYNKNIYLAYRSSPYEISQYTDNLELTKILHNKKLKTNPLIYSFEKKNQPIIQGDFTISNIFIDNGTVYSSFGGGLNGTDMTLNKDYYITVHKKNGNIEIISIPCLKNMKVYGQVLGVVNRYIYYYIEGSKDEINKIVNNDIQSMNMILKLKI